MLYIYYEHVVFKEIVEELQQILLDHGFKVVITHQIKTPNFLDLYIILGMNDWTSPITPCNYIVYQLEQTTSESSWFSPTYLGYLKNAIEIWDYSLVNYAHLRKIGLEKIKYVPLLYMKTVSPKRASAPEIDILFYGSLNERRQKILDQLKPYGFNLVIKHHLWGEERENLIARSKIILNLHYYEHSILETARLSYLLSQNCLIVSEKSKDPILDQFHQPWITLVETDQIGQTCQSILSRYPDEQHRIAQQCDLYRQHPYEQSIPFATLDQYRYLITTSPIETSKAEVGNALPLPPMVDNHDLFEAEYEINQNREMILKLPKFSDQELPYVSIVTVTYNRKKVFPMAIRNWELFTYPREKLEWVIVDDSDDGTALSSLLPKSNQIKYYRLTTTGRLSIGQKRNFGVEKAEHNYIVFMDDDDYYYPLSIYARIALLLKYPNYDLVGVTDLDIYDVVNNFSAHVKGALISEASMGFRKSFWNEEQFPEKFNTLGEGFPFTKNRRNRIIRMPSCFNLIAITHWSNYTQNARSHDRFKNIEKKGNILSVLDTTTRLFIADLFESMRKQNLKE